MLFKNEQSEKRVILVNQNAAEFQPWNDKTIVQLDKMLNISNYGISETVTKAGDTIQNLFIETANTTYLVPLSRQFDHDALYTREGVTGNVFRLTHKKGPEDVEGVYPYSGPLYVSYGKAGGITLNVISSYTEEQAAKAAGAKQQADMVGK